MNKSFKICHCDVFDKTKFEKEKLTLNSQRNLKGVPASPDTTIYKSHLGTAYEDFETYRIEHEHNVNVSGRVNNVQFQQFIRKGEILGLQSEARRLLLLTGKKDDILSFCRYTASTELVQLSTIEVDMSQLQEKLPTVNLVWFKFPTGMIKASALMGEHIEQTPEFEQAKNFGGEISTLSFHIEDKKGVKHPIMVTHDGAVVLQSALIDISQEIELVLEVKQELLDGLYIEKPVGKKTNSPITTP